MLVLLAPGPVDSAAAAAAAEGVRMAFVELHLRLSISTGMHEDVEERREGWLLTSALSDHRPQRRIWQD